MEYGKVSFTKEEMEKRRNESTFSKEVVKEVNDFDKDNIEKTKQYLEEVAK